MAINPNPGGPYRPGDPPERFDYLNRYDSTDSPGAAAWLLGGALAAAVIIGLVTFSGEPPPREPTTQTTQNEVPGPTPVAPTPTPPAPQ